MGGVFGFGEDLKHVRYNVPWREYLSVSPPSTPEWKARAATLLPGSESLSAFFRQQRGYRFDCSTREPLHGRGTTVRNLCKGEMLMDVMGWLL